MIDNESRPARKLTGGPLRILGAAWAQRGVGIIDLAPLGQCVCEALKFCWKVGLVWCVVEFVYSRCIGDFFINFYVFNVILCRFMGITNFFSKLRKRSNFCLTNLSKERK